MISRKKWTRGNYVAEISNFFRLFQENMAKTLDYKGLLLLWQSCSNKQYNLKLPRPTEQFETKEKPFTKEICRWELTLLYMYQLFNLKIIFHCYKMC